SGRRTADSRQRLPDLLAARPGVEPQHPTRRFDDPLVEHLGRPRQVTFSGTIHRFAGLDLSFEAEPVVSYIPQVIVDVIRVIRRRWEDGFDVSDVELPVADRIHESELLTEVEKANVHPKGQGDFLLLAASLP